MRKVLKEFSSLKAWNKIQKICLQIKSIDDFLEELLIDCRGWSLEEVFDQFVGMKVDEIKKEYIHCILYRHCRIPAQLI